MKFKLIYFLTLNLFFSIGLDGLYIPKTSTELAIGKYLGFELENVHELLDDNSFLSYQSYSWLPGISGHSIHWKNSSGLIKYVSFNSISDREVFFHDEIPNENENFKLPASIYSNSIVIGVKKNNFVSALELKTFLSRLYTEKIYGLLGSLYFTNNVYFNISIEGSIQNIGYIRGDIENQSLPLLINIDLNKKNEKFPISFGSGSNYIKSKFNPYFYLIFKNNYISTISSISITENKNLKYSGGIYLNYKEFTLGYILSSPILESASLPQFISLKFNY